MEKQRKKSQWTKVKKTCPTCGKTFHARAQNRFCSTVCQKRGEYGSWRDCVECGKRYWMDYNWKSKTYCSQTCKDIVFERMQASAEDLSSHLGTMDLYHNPEHVPHALLNPDGFVPQGRVSEAVLKDRLAYVRSGMEEYKDAARRN